MKRRALALLGCAALIVLAGAWLRMNFEQVEIRVPVGPSAAARANPYLAAMRFAERLGWRTSLEAHPTRLQPVSGRVTVLLPAGRAWLTPMRVQDLVRAAENGAHLVVQPEPLRRPDALLEAFGVGRRGVARRAEPVAVEFPGAAATLRLDLVEAQVLEMPPAGAQVLVADREGVRIASLRRGAGRVTVIVGMQRFDNASIGRHDHADLLRRVLAMAPGEQLLVVQSTGTPGLWRWLAEHAVGALIAAALVLVGALWRIVPRFGPVLAAPPPARRALLEHLRAAGRLRWSQGARSELLGAPRAQLERHLAVAAPRLSRLPADQRHAEIAAQLGTDAAAVERALRAPAANARATVQTVAALASIHAGLRGARRHIVPMRTRR